jgi:hypothetical protein
VGAEQQGEGRLDPKNAFDSVTWGRESRGTRHYYLDRLAALTLSAGETFPEVRSIYMATPGLKVPAAAKSYSSAVPEPLEVRLRG